VQTVVREILTMSENIQISKNTVYLQLQQRQQLEACQQQTGL